MTAEEICDTSTKLVTFLDLAGHKKYIRTTIQGLSGYLPHHAMLVVMHIPKLVFGNIYATVCSAHIDCTQSGYEH